MVKLSLILRIVLLCFMCGVGAGLSCSLFADDQVSEQEVRSLRALLIDEIHERETALQQLWRLYRDSPEMLSRDHLPDVFLGLSATPSPNYVYRSVTLLAQLPEDPRVSTAAQSILRNPSSTPTAQVAALAYLRVQKRQAFERFVSSRPFGSLSREVASLFADEPVVSGSRSSHLGNLIDAWLNWRPAPGVFDLSNPHRMAVLSNTPYLEPVVLKKFPPSQNPELPVRLLWVLGEVGSPGFFELLLGEYLARPNMRTAISLGSSLTFENQSLLFDEFAGHEEDLRKLMKDMLGREWNTISYFSVTDFRQHFRNNARQIALDCRERSQPMPM